jgi:hypothetical protein
MAGTPSAQAFGDDDVEGLAECLFLREAEHAFGGGVPEDDRAACIRDDDGVADGVHELGGIDGAL